MLEPHEGKLSRAVLRGEGGSNTPDLPDDYFGQLAERERRPIEARKKVRSTRTLSTHVRTVWDQSGLQSLQDGSNPSVHLCLVRLMERAVVF